MCVIFLPFKPYKPVCFVLIAMLSLSGCANHKEQAEKQVTTAVSAEQYAKQTLSEGKDVTLNTSQGVVTVQPTVVDMEQSQQSEKGDAKQSSSLYYDPFERFNRAIFSFNHQAYTYVVIPVARGYKTVVPASARSKISNVFDNLREPLNLLNNIGAGEGKRAASNFGRFMLNSTVGLLGLFDPATHWFDIEPAQQRLSQTLQGYGVENGAFIVIPLLGQSDVRGLSSLLTESIIHPLGFIAEPAERAAARSINIIDTFSTQEELYQKLYENSQDPYILFRNQYLQGVARDAEFQPD